METHSIWLDQLSLDICTRIFISAKTSSYRSLLNLANASSFQRTALKQALQYKLDLLELDQESAADEADSEFSYGPEPPSDNREPNPLESFFSFFPEGATISFAEGDDCSHDSQQTNSNPNTENSNSDASEHHSVDDNENESASADEEESRSADENETASVDEEESRSADETETDSHSRTETSSADEGETPFEHTANNDSDDGENQCEQALRTLYTDYATVLSEDVREVCILGEVVDLLTQPMFQSCVTSHSLLMLRIHQLPDSMASFQHGPNIRVLELLLDDCDLLGLLRGLSDLPLRELVLETTGDKCMHNQFTDDADSHGVLAELFPQVETLALACATCGEEEKPPWYLWNIMDKFPKLRRVVLREGVPDSAIEKLGKMEWVTLVAGDVYELVEKIPDRIIGLSTSALWTKLFPRRAIPCQHTFERFENCVQLEELTCVLMPGAERGLLKVARNLRILGVAFAKTDGRDEESERNPVPLVPMDGVLCEVVKAAPFLESLRLINMRIRRCELQELLIGSGNRLEVFEEEVFVEKYIDQFIAHTNVFMFEKKDNKMELEELAKTMQTAAFHNPKLRKFKLDIRAGWFTDLDSVESTLGKLKASFNVLRRRAVGLDMRDLKELLRKFENGSFGLIDVMMSLGIGNHMRIPGGAIMTF